MKVRHDGTVQDIYRGAIQKYQKDHLDRDAVETIASLMEMSAKTLYAILEGERFFDSVSEETFFFTLTGFSQGYEMKQELLNPQSNTIPIKGKAKA